MIGYALLVLIALIVTLVGFVVVGVAIWGWRQEKKNLQASQKPAAAPSVAPAIESKT